MNHNPRTYNLDFVVPIGDDNYRFLNYNRFISPHKPDRDSIYDESFSELCGKLDYMKEVLTSMIPDYKNEEEESVRKKLGWAIHIHNEDCELYGLKDYLVEGWDEGY